MRWSLGPVLRVRYMATLYDAPQSLTRPHDTSHTKRCFTRPAATLGQEPALSKRNCTVSQPHFCFHLLPFASFFIVYIPTLDPELLLRADLSGTTTVLVISLQNRSFIVIIASTILSDTQRYSFPLYLPQSVSVPASQCIVGRKWVSHHHRHTSWRSWASSTTITVIAATI